MDFKISLGDSLDEMTEQLESRFLATAVGQLNSSLVGLVNELTGESVRHRLKKSEEFGGPVYTMQIVTGSLTLEVDLQISGEGPMWTVSCDDGRRQDRDGHHVPGDTSLDKYIDAVLKYTQVFVREFLR